MPSGERDKSELTASALEQRKATQSRPKFEYVFIQIQTDYLNLTRRPDLVIINRKKRALVDFAVPVDHIVKVKERQKES